MQKKTDFPSPITCRNLNGLQLFTTDAGVQYGMGFRNVSHFLSPVLGIYDIRIYTFDFFASGHSRRDERIAPTILSAIEEFFTDSNWVLTYICDSSDGRQAERQRLFSAWIRNMAGIKQARIEAGDEFIGGILTRQDFQYWNVLQSELFHPDRGIGQKFE